MLATASEAFRRRLDPTSRAPLAVAFSGGGDSLALLQMAATWCERAGRPLSVFTVDHGLHPDSAAWTAEAGRLARSLGAHWSSLAWTGEKPDTGLPAAAREARHRLLAQAARRAGASVLLFGHTADDVQESALMRAETPHLGWLSEWSPSAAWPAGRGVFILRPLLGERRSTLRDWLRTHGLAWLEDPANADLRSARSHARAQLAGQASAAPPDTGRDDAALAELALTCSTTPDGRLILPRRRIAEAPPATARRLLSAALLCASGGTRPPRGRVLDRLALHIADDGAFTTASAGARLEAGFATIVLGREAGERARGKLEAVLLARNEVAVFDGRFAMTTDAAGLAVDAAAGRMARLGASDLAALRRLPPAARRAFPVLVNAAGEVSLPTPFGGGPAAAHALAGPRFYAACGVVHTEADIAEGGCGEDRPLTLS